MSCRVELMEPSKGNCLSWVLQLTPYLWCILDWLCATEELIGTSLKRTTECSMDEVCLIERKCHFFLGNILLVLGCDVRSFILDTPQLGFWLLIESIKVSSYCDGVISFWQSQWLKTFKLSWATTLNVEEASINSLAFVWHYIGVILGRKVSSDRMRDKTRTTHQQCKNAANHQLLKTKAVICFTVSF